MYVWHTIMKDGGKHSAGNTKELRNCNYARSSTTTGGEGNICLHQLLWWHHSSKASVCPSSIANTILPEPP